MVLGKICAFLPCALLLFTSVLGQPYVNYCAPTVKSVKSYVAGDEVSSPVIGLGSLGSICVEFDDLSDEVLTLDYTIVHCSPDWHRTDIMFEEYATGFEFNSLGTYYSSQGTSVLYTHYSLTLPNNDVSVLLSGNYILKVVDSYDHERVLLMQRFVVVENKVQFDASVVQPLNPSLKNSCQQLTLQLSYSELGFVDPFTEIFTTITQNNQTYNAKVDVKPTFQGNNMVSYSAPDSLIFSGGYEYRDLIYRSSTYQSSKIRNVSRVGGEYHLELSPDYSNRHKNYSEARDINGKYIIKRDDCLDSNKESEYLWFYFSLQSPELPNVDVYLYGELTNWEIFPLYKLGYSHIASAYETRVLLKQGIYNYRYVTVDRTNGQASHDDFEGNYFATKNSYQIFTYYKPIGGRYWRAVGHGEVVSK